MSEHPPGARPPSKQMPQTGLHPAIKVLLGILIGIPLLLLLAALLLFGICALG